MKYNVIFKLALIIIFYYLFSVGLQGQIIPASSNNNQGISWESIFTQGNAGKVNRGLVDQDGNMAVVFMPDSESRIHKINGNTGQLIWTKTITGTVGYGITEIRDAGRSDYIVSGGIGNTQERWVARLNGDNGDVMWDKTYTYTGGSNQYDAVRMTLVGSDGFIYGSGFVNGDEAATIFVVYGGQAMVMKINPSNGNEVWTHTNSATAYALAVVQSSAGDLYYGSKVFDSNLTLTKINTSGTELWTNTLTGTDVVIPYDLAITSNDVIYFGGHSGRTGTGEPFDYTCIKLDLNANMQWIKHYANPRGYSLEYIRNELYGIKVNNEAVYMFGGSGDESNSYSATNQPFESSDVWNGWVLITDLEGNILRSDLLCHDQANTATEYGDIFQNGYVVFNDTDAMGDTEVGVMKVDHGTLTSSTSDLYISSSRMSVFPNPTKDYFTIEGDFQDYTIQVVDISGKVYSDLSDQSSPIRIDLSSLPTGVYLVKVINEVNTKLTIKKIIKE
ncbi:MAG: T9SS type A sorting domain-containing protein [Saprospiraceae bacterium]|nr:T9SS type A sorting domain-containing protein [Saprospiraceae bacterium]